MWATRLLPLGLLSALCLVKLGKAQDLHETGMPDGLEIYDFESEEEMDRVLFDPENGVARRKTVVIGVYDPQCRQLLEQPWFTWGTARHSDPAMVAVARVERSVAPDLVHIMEIPEYLCASAVFVPCGGDRDNMRGFPADLELERDWFSWVFQQMRVEVTFHNVRAGPITLHYLEGTDIDAGSDHVIEVGESSTIEAFVSHVFFTRDASTGQLLDWLEVEGQGSYTVGHDIEPNCSDLLGGCEDKETTLLRFAYNVLYRGRLALNAIQPTRVERLTVTGFERHKLPQDVYAPLREYWDTQQESMLPETRVGPAVNQLDADTYILVYPEHLKERLFDGVKPLLEDWSGKTLEPTSCYGIRKYTNGSRLLMHVDTMDTHAVSGIINVDQEVQEPWELEILDHDGGLHHVSMEAGDILFYESAKLLHGRPRPLNGNHFANIFVHYRPTDGWSPLPL